MLTQPTDVPPAFTQWREPAAPSPLISSTSATYIPRHQPAAHGESNSEDESPDPDRSTSKVKESSRTSSGTPPPADERLDPGVAELIGSAQGLTIADSPSEAPVAPTLNLSLARTDPDSFLREIIVKYKYPVLFLGESPTRALPLAIGVMRGSLQGIRATCHHHRRDKIRCHWHAGDTVKIGKAIKEDMSTRVNSNRYIGAYDDQT